MPFVNASDVQIIFLEMQPAIVASSATQPAAALRRATTAVREMADALGIPMLATVVPVGSDAPILIAELGSMTPHTRTSISLFGNEDAGRLVAENKRTTLVIAGVSTEIAILHTALDACRAGYDVQLLIDCCGGLNDRSESAALRQMEAAGTVVSSASSFFTGLVDDMTSDEGRAVMGALAKLWSWNPERVGAALKTAVATLVEAMQGAWRCGDAERFAAVFTPDARFVAFDGTILLGPQAIAAFHALPFATYLAKSELILNVLDVRLVAKDLAIISSQGGIVKNGEGKGDLTGDSAQTFLVRVADTGFQIEYFQNTRIRPIKGSKSAEVWKEFDRAWFALDENQS
jgi:uncharacterized protein (TIGR02246 family)